MFIDRLLEHVAPGLIYGIGAIGLSLSFRYLRFPDLTALGSIVLGGIVCIDVAKATSPLLGLTVGTLSASALGALTGVLATRGRIEPVLAGIVSFTAAFTPGYLLTNGGRTEFSPDYPDPAVLHSTPHSSDIAVLLVVGLTICLAISVFIRTKIGSLVLAMQGERAFLRYRHRYRHQVFVIVLMLGNGLVGLAGAFSALTSRSANVLSHHDFLPVALGAIFAGDAIGSWIARRLRPGEDDQAERHSKREKPGGPRRLLRRLLSEERDESSKVGVLSATYLLGGVFFVVTTNLVLTNAFTSIHPRLALPSNGGAFAWIVTAGLIVAFIWWARDEDA